MQSLTIKLDMVGDIKNASFKFISLNVIFYIRKKGTGLYVSVLPMHIYCKRPNVWFMKRLGDTPILGTLSGHQPSSWVDALIILSLSNRPLPPGKILLHFLDITLY